MTTLQDRAAGAVVGALIGDALGLGPHWYYDLDELHRDYGTWITDYTDPKPHRYHGGMKAGQLSQSGVILRMLMRCVLSGKNFSRKLDEELFPQLDGTPEKGPGGYTSQSIRATYELRKQGKSWGECAGNADTTEALERCVVLAARHAKDPARVFEEVVANCALTQSDNAVMAMTTAFSCVLALLVQGEPLDGAISGKLMGLKLPFHTVTVASPEKPLFPSPDALLTPGFIARAAVDPEVRIDPAWKVSLVYGMPCAIYHQIPAAYYLAARFSQDFESAVLHAINGGGQNEARAVLTGALVGAQVGMCGIPQRFILGLEGHAEILREARALALAL